MSNSDSDNKPPSFAKWLLKYLARYNDNHSIIQDSEYTFSEILKDSSIHRARLWYWKNIIYSISVCLRSNVYGAMIMFKNYLKITLRSILMSKGYSFINIIGLTLGLLCCILILLYAHFEFSYDNYHKDIERVFRLGLRWEGQNATNYYTTTSWPAAKELRESFPQVEYVGRLKYIANNNSAQVVKYENKIFYEKHCFFATRDIFKILTISFIEGDSKADFIRPGTMLLTKSMAEKYFAEKSPIGEIISVGNRDYEIIGVIADPPNNTHFKYNFIAPMMSLGPPPRRDSWGNISYFTYLKLLPEIDPAEFEKQISKMADRYEQDFLKRNKENHTYFLQPVKDIHLYSNLRRELEPPGNPKYLYILSTVAILILTLSCLNFICLATAMSRERAKEVGIRKVVGAQRLQLILQFLFESISYVLFASICAFVLAVLILPYYNTLLNSSFTAASIFQPGILFILSALIIVTCIGVGVYPSLFLSSFAIEKTTGSLSGSGPGKSLVRKILVIGQYVISIPLIILTLVIHLQIGFMKDQDLGFDKEHKLVIQLMGRTSLRDNYKPILSEFTGYNSITGATVSSNIPGRQGPMTDNNFIRLAGDDFGDKHRFNYFYVDYDYLSDHNFKIIAGRPFQIEKSMDASNSLIINESGIEELGLSSPENAIGRKIDWRQSKYEIIGIVEDFYYGGLKSQIEPFFFAMVPYYKFITFSVKAENLDGSINFIEAKWEQLFPGIPFEYFFLDEDIDVQYTSEETMARIIGVFSFLSIIITCLGIFGLTAYTVERHTKEIGIRKVLGSSVMQIISILFKDLVKWNLIANIISWPIAWYMVNRWLQSFYYRIDLGYEIFLLTGTLVLVISIFSMSYKTINAAQANPVDSLRYE